MSNFLKFLENLAQHCGAKFEVEKFKAEDEYELAANILNEINKFLYQKKATLPPEYISEFHKYWEENHKEDIKNRESSTARVILDVGVNKHALGDNYSEEVLIVDK